mmetsp:Transcript_8018/g.22048  ORF Transcript_8018/g.22048 Transcript_8018/m.22048 type:complete len:314 (-) Transcript_8018:326-1267(-)
MDTEAPGVNNIVSKRTASSAAFLHALGGSTASAPPEREAVVDGGRCGGDSCVVHGLLSPAESAALVRAAEAVPADEGGFSFWGDPSPSRAAHLFRSADTLEAHEPGLAGALWARMAHLVDKVVHIVPDSPRFERDLEGAWEPVGLNPHLLFARYLPGGHFAPHVDGQTEVDFNTRSLFSVIIYLSTCEAGGATRLLEGEQGEATTRDGQGRLVATEEAVAAVVRPRCGSALVFYHGILHDGDAVAPGEVKYIVRTDVMYRRVEPLCTSEQDVRAYELYRRARDCEAAGETTEAARLFRSAFKTSHTIAEMYGG